MNDHMNPLSPELLAYLRRHSLTETAEQAALRRDTAKLPEGGWVSAPEQSQFLAFLARLMGARRILEVGTFTGYTTLTLALALPDDGRLVTIDMVTDYTDVGEPHWKSAGVRDRIDLRIGPALEVMERLAGDVEPGYFDMAFIDCNKKSYPGYYERALPMVRTGGLIAFDNMFWYGRVLDPANEQKSTRAIRKLNESLPSDTRVEMIMLPLDDGLTLARKR